MKPYEFTGNVYRASGNIILDRYNISNIDKANKLRFETFDLKPIEDILNNLFKNMYLEKKLPTFNTRILCDYLCGNFDNLKHKVVEQHAHWCIFESWYTRYIQHLQLMSEGKHDLSFLLTDKCKRLALECYIYIE